MVAPASGARLQSRRDRLGADPGRQQQAGQRIGRIHWPLARRVRMQWQEDLPVRELPGELMRRVHYQGGFADPGHPPDRVDPHDSAPRCRISQRGRQPCQLSGPAGEPRDVTRQHPRRRRRAAERSRSAYQILACRCQVAPPGCGLELDPLRTHEAQRIGQQPGGLLAGGGVDPAF